ncbi:MAG: 50S ribosomal protein L5 [Candidatus Pacebacteria bacterium]|nr:50S ribosomal protein L5 [Candidatus Paceibacterota bacterium]
MNSIKEKQNTAFDTLKSEFEYKNKMQSPKLEKVVLNVGVGSIRSDKKKTELVEDRLTKIAGQKPAYKNAKKSIAAFKLREGEKVGYQVILRGKRMFGFLDKLVSVALPRTKDFRGLNLKSIDEMGNATLGIKEHVIFPETSDEEMRDIFGMSITIVTTAKNKKEAEAFLRHIGFPFKKAEEKKK